MAVADGFRANQPSVDSDSITALACACAIPRRSNNGNDNNMPNDKVIEAQVSHRTRTEKQRRIWITVNVIDFRFE